MREIGAAAVRCALALWMLMVAATATAQTTGEIWGNLTVDWLASERLVYTLDVEPKVQVTAVTKQSRFANVDVWPTVEFALIRHLPKLHRWQRCTQPTLADISKSLLAGFRHPSLEPWPQRRA